MLRASRALFCSSARISGRLLVAVVVVGADVDEAFLLFVGAVVGVAVSAVAVSAVAVDDGGVVDVYVYY